jgi:hypothetical protein
VVRFVRLCTFLVSLFTTSLAHAAPLTGRVVDPAGRPVPRAIVRAIDGSGRTLAEVFTTPDGTFRVDPGTTECTLEASLTGFTAASGRCANDTTLTLALAALSQ